MKKVFALVVLSMIIMAVFSPVALASGPIKTTMVTNFNTPITQLSWNRIELTIQNQGNKDFTGQVEVFLGGKYIQDVFIEKGRQITVEFYLHPAAFESNYSGVAYVKDNNNRVVTTDRFEVNFQQYSKYMGVITTNQDRMRRIGNLSNEQVVFLKPAYFNNFMFMDNLSVIVIDEVDNFNLTSAQRENLELWVKRGGLLVVGGGRNATKNSTLISNELLPYVLDRNQDRQLDGDFFINPTTVLHTSGKVKGELLLGDADFPLLVKGQVEKGTVIFSTLNLQDSIFNNATNFEKYWNTILFSEPMDVGVKGSFMYTEMQRFLSMMSVDLSAINLITPPFLIAGLIIYILLVGPINFLILKKKKRLDFGWVTIPALSLIFTILLFSVGSIGRSNVMTVKQVNAIEFVGDEMAYVESINNIFMPKRNNKSISTNFNYVTPITQGMAIKDNKLDFTEARIWSNQRVLINTSFQEKGPRVKVQRFTGRTEITVENRSEHDYFESYFYNSGHWYVLGELKAGETKTMSLTQPIGSINYDIIFDRYDITPSHWYVQLFESIAIQSNQAYLGLSDTQMPVPIIDKSNIVPLNINIVRDTYMEIQYKEIGAIENLRGKISKFDFDFFQTWNNSLYLEGEGELEIVFNLPHNMDYTGAKGRLETRIYRGNTNLNLEIYNAIERRWESMTYSDVITIDNLSNYLLNDTLRIKFISTEKDYFEFNYETMSLSVIGGAN